MLYPAGAANPEVHSEEEYVGGGGGSLLHDTGWRALTC